MKNILIKSGTLVNATGKTRADIFIEDNKIKYISENINLHAERIIDAKDKLIMPGGVDPHVHFDLPTFVGNTADDFVSGSKAALHGGTTTVIDFVSPAKGEFLVEALIKRQKESQAALCNVFLHVTPSWWGEKTAHEIETCIKNFNIKSFKLYMAYKKGIGVNDDIILKTMNIAAKNDAIVTLHCENDELIEYHRQIFVSQQKTSPKYHALSRPPEAEKEAIDRAILYSKTTNCTIYIVHVSSKMGIERIAQAQKEGVKIIAETCPHYLLLDDSLYNNDFQTAAKFVLSPPLRKQEDNLALWEAINSGVIQTIGTDHCSFNIKGQKDFGKNDFTKIVNGAGGVEHRIELLYTYGVLTNKISINKMVEIVCENPAKIFNIKNKGYLKEGFDADLIIWDTNYEKTISIKNHKQQCDNNIYEGTKTRGRAEIVIFNGQIIENS